MAWLGRLVFLTNGASQPHALPVPSCPDCPVPGARVTLGEAQGQSPSRTQSGRSPGLRFQEAGSSGSLCGWRGHTGMGGASRLVSPVGDTESREPQRAVGNPAQQEGREEGAGRKGRGVKKGHPGKEREEKRESKRTVACFSSTFFF